MQRVPLLRLLNGPFTAPSRADGLRIVAGLPSTPRGPRLIWMKLELPAEDNTSRSWRGRHFGGDAAAKWTGLRDVRGALTRGTEQDGLLAPLSAFVATGLELDDDLLRTPIDHDRVQGRVRPVDFAGDVEQGEDAVSDLSLQPRVVLVAEG